MFYQSPLFFKYPNFEWLNYFSSFNFQPPEPKDDPRLAHSLYQTKYLQNYESLKEEYKSTVLPTISFVLFHKYLTFPTETKRYILLLNFKNKDYSFTQKIYIYLCALSFYEINNNKNHDDFVFNFLLSFILYENFIRTLTTGIISLNCSLQ